MAKVDNLKKFLTELKRFGESVTPADTCRRLSEKICNCPSCKISPELEATKDETTGDDSGNATDATTATPYKTNTYTSSNLQLFSIFNSSMNKAASSMPVLKPDLTPEEKELLKHILSVLKLDFEEFKLMLKSSVKLFVKSLKENLLTLGIPHPQQNPELFLKRSKELNLIPEKLLENLHKHEADQKQQLENSIGLRPDRFRKTLRR